MDYSQFRCKWISKSKIWEVAERVRNRYWPENSTPVDVESIIEFRLKMTIDVRKGLLSTIDMLIRGHHTSFFLAGNEEWQTQKRLIKTSVVSPEFPKV